ncbi:MAG: isochorismatase family protein [Limnohabitans sp.]|jgi:nicotinamidase-related amidase|nr:isochorismatase family protein [Limnohabitans sp.]
MPIPRLTLERTALIVIDVQERLLPTIVDSERVVTNCTAALELAKVLGLPAIVTEQYVKGLGHSAPTLAAAAAGHAKTIEKTRFSAVIPAVEEFLSTNRCDDVLICGVEAHVCVQQTVLDLLAIGRQPFLLTDAISAGKLDQIAPAFRRMERAGAVPSGVLGAAYEILGDAAHPQFKAVLGVVKTLRAPFQPSLPLP